MMVILGTTLLLMAFTSFAPDLMESFREIKTRVAAVASWDSVYTEARFTLEPYQAFANAAEKRAAANILKCLMELAAT